MRFNLNGIINTDERELKVEHICENLFFNCSKLQWNTYDSQSLTTLLNAFHEHKIFKQLCLNISKILKYASISSASKQRKR